MRKGAILLCIILGPLMGIMNSEILPRLSLTNLGVLALRGKCESGNKRQIIEAACLCILNEIGGQQGIRF